MKFRYKKYAADVRRPVIPIALSYKGGTRIWYEVLVDSGADICIFDAQIGELLGINVAAGEKKNVSGITGVSEPYYMQPVEMNVGGWSFHIKAGFLPNISRMGYGVVGQQGFFDLFIIKFDLLKGEVELKQRN